MTGWISGVWFDNGSVECGPMVAIAIANNDLAIVMANGHIMVTDN